MSVHGACSNCQRVWAWSPRRGLLRVSFGEAFCPDCGQELKRTTVVARRSYLEASATPLDAAAAAPLRAQRIAEHAARSMRT